MKRLFFLMLALSLLGSGCARERSEVVGVEIRLAEMEPAEGLTEMTLGDTGQKFYLHKEAALTNSDVASASVVMFEERPVVELILTGEGSGKFARFTAENVTKRAGIIVDGKLVSAPVIRDQILAGKVIISGHFTRSEAERMARRIQGK